MISHLIALLQQKGLLLSDREIAAFSESQSLMHDEDIADALWLAAKIGDAYEVDEPDEIDESGEAIVVETIDDNTIPSAPQPFVSAYMPQAVKPDTSSVETTEQGLPIQVQAAPALPDPRSIGRSLRPLMRKVPSLTRSDLDEIATVNRIAERDIWVPILKPSPERWFDLDLVIEASKFSFIWQDTLDEFQHLLECQGAFRNVRAWYVKESDTGQPKLVAKKQQRLGAGQDEPLRSHKELVDVSGRRLVLFVSDCRSRLWRQGKIHDWLTLWSQHGPAAIVQLLPERLWSQSELDVGFAVQVGSLLPGAPNQRLQVRELPLRTQIAPADALTVPVVTLTASALKQWALVVSAAGRQRSPARLFDLSWVKDSERDRSLAVVQPKSAKDRLELFMATASPIAQRLASMMAAVPVELPVVYLIQQELLKEVQPVHIAEVYASVLLEEIQREQPSSDALTRYDFVKGVRGLLNEVTPLDETLGVLEALSQRIARTLGFEIKSFTALLSPKSDWSQETKDTILPFAQIATEVLHRLGGDYAELAEMVERDAAGYPDWIQPLESDPAFPDLEILEFTTAQLVEAVTGSAFPALQTQEVEVVTIVLEAEPDRLEPFEFEVATIERQPKSKRSQQQSEWIIKRQRRQAQQWLEPLGDETQIEMVAVPAGTFLMGSSDHESERSDNEGPQHEVSVSAYLTGRYPITQAQWRFVAGLDQVNRELDLEPTAFKGGSPPVEQVSWHDAVEFCDRLSSHTGRDYRLPTEAEWEYACRAGTTTPFHFGETITTDLANYDGKDHLDGKWSGSYGQGPKGEYRQETTPVDHFAIANAFGLCDMHGNVWEWCFDQCHENYEVAPINGNVWLANGDETGRVLRGGSWSDAPKQCRSAYRNHFEPDFRYFIIGFRVVCSAPSTLHHQILADGISIGSV